MIRVQIRSHKLSEDQKKRLLNGVCPLNRVKTKKKTKQKDIHRTLGLYSAGI